MRPSTAKVPEFLKAKLMQCFEYDPKKRPKMPEILSLLETCDFYTD